MAGEQLFLNRPLPGVQINYSHPLAKGLVGCWLMNEQAGIRCIDSSPYNNHGTMVGFGVPANSRSSQGIKLNGSTAYIDCGNKSNLNAPTITLLGWFKKDVDIQLNNTGLFGSGNNMFVLMPNGIDVSCYITTPLNHIISAVNPLSSKYYTQVVCIYDSKGGNFKLYINSILISSDDSQLGDLLTPNTNFIIGRDRNEINRYFQGSCALAQRWNRDLTKDEIKELYLNPYAMFKR